MVMLILVVHVRSYMYIVIASILLAMASGEHPLFSGSGPSDECNSEYTYEINSCDPPLSSDCDFGSFSGIVEENSNLATHFVLTSM